MDAYGRSYIGSYSIMKCGSGTILLQNQPSITSKIMQNGVHFFQASWAVFPFLASLDLKKDTFCENQNVEYNQITHLIFKITVSQLQANSIDFKILIFVTYSETGEIIKNKLFLKLHKFPS